MLNRSVGTEKQQFNSSMDFDRNAQDLGKRSSDQRGIG
jgi:hypothetical protein